MAKVGRKVTVYTPERLREIEKQMDKYTAETEIPILAEFAVSIKVHRQALYEHPELTDGIKRLITKKEAQLETLALYGGVNSTMAIFSLKQIGWTDRKEVEHSGGIKFVKDIPGAENL